MKELLAEIDDQILLVDGFDAALVGYVERCGSTLVALYDKDKCIDILVERDGMDLDDAVQYFEFNILGSYVGEYTPCFATFNEKIN